MNIVFTGLFSVECTLKIMSLGLRVSISINYSSISMKIEKEKELIQLVSGSDSFPPTKKREEASLCMLTSCAPVFPFSSNFIIAFALELHVCCVCVLASCLTSRKYWSFNHFDISRGMDYIDELVMRWTFNLPFLTAIFHLFFPLSLIPLFPPS